MKVTVSNAPKSQKKLELEIGVDAFNAAYDKEFKKVQKEAKIHGFRQGKAPVDVIKKQYGHQINGSALENLINDTVRDAIIQNQINALSQPEVKDVKFEEGQPITLNVFVDVYPEVSVENYSGFEFTRELTVVEDADVDSVLENIRERMASFQPVTDKRKAAKMGDMTVIDFVGKKDGVAFEGGTAENFPLTLGSGQFIPGFEEGVEGMKLEQEKDIEVIFPEQYHEKSLAGQPVVFTVTLKELKKKELPELNDDMAKDMDEGFETLAELKAKLRKDLEREAENIAKDRLFNEMIGKIIDANAFEVPTALIREQAGRLAQQMVAQYYQMGINPEQVGLSIDTLVSQQMPMAESQVKGAIVINAVADANELKATDEDVDKLIAEYAEMSGKTVEDFKAELQQHRQLEGFKNLAFTDKVYALLCSKNTVKDEKVTRAEREKRAGEKAAEIAAAE